MTGVNYNRIQWRDALPKKTDEQDQIIMITQADYGHDPSTLDIFDLTTSARKEDDDGVETEEISIYFKDFPRIIRMMAEVINSVNKGETVVKKLDLEDEDKEELR